MYAITIGGGLYSLSQVGYITCKESSDYFGICFTGCSSVRLRTRATNKRASSVGTSLRAVALGTCWQRLLGNQGCDAVRDTSRPYRLFGSMRVSRNFVRNLLALLQRLQACCEDGIGNTLGLLCCQLLSHHSPSLRLSQIPATARRLR